MEADRALVNVIYDQFGEGVKIRPWGEERVRFSAEVQVSDLFFGWCCSFGSGLRLVAPRKVCAKLKDYVARLHQQYEEAE